tara:strand:- start:277 stop:1455 length:1179 start_codon:yes stop_codon:yes gene_type:complete
MEENKKQEVAEAATEQPKVDDKVEKLKIKKPKIKKFSEPEDGIVKVDLKELAEKAKEITKVDLSKNSETENIEVKEEEVKDTEDTPLLEEVVSEEKEEKQVEEIKEPVKIPEPPKVELPENIMKVVDFMKDTGGDIYDYVKLNRDYSELDNHTLLKEYYKSTKPHLQPDEIDFLMEDQFSYDAEVDDEREVKRKKLALKEQVANARTELDSLKSKYYDEIKMGSKLTSEQQDAINFFNKYNEESEEKQKVDKEAGDHFLNKTNEVFNDKFKGFEYKVGDKKYRFNVKDASKVKNTQSDLNNFVKKFLNKENLMEDAKGYHKSLFTAMNSDAIANHFYEQGKADALKESIAKSKNIDMNPRQAHGGTVEAGGIKVRVLGNDSNDFKFKIKKKK